MSDGYIEFGLLARGGMGEVRLGERRAGDFRRLVAIKRLRPEYSEDPKFHEMFLAEAKLAGLVRHANVVSVLDVGIDERGPYLVMDFIEGMTVARILRVGRVPLQVALRIVRQVALGLAAAHALEDGEGTPLGLVHRDISPQNILVGFDGVARLTDFGIAKAQGSTQTSTGVLKGKVGYMAPEQLRFLPPTTRSDLFALGIVLHELLTGARLYGGGDDGAAARRILDEPSPDLYSAVPDAPSPLIELHFELLAKDAEDRPVSAEDVATRLGAMIDELVAVEGGVELRAFIGERFADERTRIRSQVQALVELGEEERAAARPRWPLLAAAGVLLGLAGVGAFLAVQDEPSVPAPAAEFSTAPTASAPVAPEPEGEPVTEPPAEAMEAVTTPAARTRMRRVRRRRPSMRPARRTMAASEPAGGEGDEREGDFSALELIRGMGPR